MTISPQRVDAATLLARHDVFWVDAYGVLVDAAGALPHAVEFWARLKDAGKRRLLLSNDASRLPATVAGRLSSLGFSIEEDEVLTSGDLLRGYFAERGLEGAATVVLGTEDSRELVRAAGGEVIAPGEGGATAAVVVAADDAGFDFLPAIEATLNAVLRAIEAGQTVELVLPNPDVIYPKAGGAFGYTAGAIAHLLEQGLVARLGEDAPAFTGLGKPHRRIFEEAALRTRPQEMTRVVMLGDQLATDIAGGSAFGVATALVETGLSRHAPQGSVQPDYLLRDLSTFLA